MRNRSTSRKHKTSKLSKSTLYTQFRQLNFHVGILGKIRQVIADTEPRESIVDIVMAQVAYIIDLVEHIEVAALMYITEEVEPNIERRTVAVGLQVDTVQQVRRELEVALLVQQQ